MPSTLPYDHFGRIACLCRDCVGFRRKTYLSSYGIKPHSYAILELSDKTFQCVGSNQTLSPRHQHTVNRVDLAVARRNGVVTDLRLVDEDQFGVVGIA